jgi:hypothetical protein
MPDTKQADLVQYLKQVPKPDAIRQELTATLRQTKLLRQLLRIAEQRERVEEARTCK